MNKKQRQQRIEELEQEIQKLKNMSDFDLEGVLRLNGEVRASVRSYGEFKEKSWWLSSDFDWQIVKDSTNTLCLIPSEFDENYWNDIKYMVNVSGDWNCKEFKENFDGYNWIAEKDVNGRIYLVPEKKEKATEPWFPN